MFEATKNLPLMLNRREFLQLGGGVAAATGIGMLDAPDVACAEVSSGANRSRIISMPTLFIVGDSTANQYGPYLREYVGSVFTVIGNPGGVPSGTSLSDSKSALKYVQKLAGLDSFSVDMLHINCGQHDLKANLKTGAKQIPIEDYEKNMREVARIARKLCRRLIWVRSTHVDEQLHNKSGHRGYYRYNLDIEAYNNAAEKAFREVGGATADLYTFSRSIPGQTFKSDGVHFVESARMLQGAFLAGVCFTLK